MNEVLFIILFWVFIFWMYRKIKNERSKKIRVITAFTGEPQYNTSRIFYEDPRVIKLPSGYYMNTRNFIKVIVYGNNLKDKEITTGDEWLVSPKFSEIKPGDIILLESDKNSQVLRKVISSDGTNVNVIWKTEYGQVISEVYESWKILGILKYKLVKEYEECNMH